MRGTLIYKEKTYHGVHAISDQHSGNISFSLFNGESEKLESFLMIMGFQVIFQKDETMIFAGFRAPDDYNGPSNSWVTEISYEFVDAKFTPAGSSIFVDDLWTRKSAGRTEEKHASIK